MRGQIRIRFLIRRILKKHKNSLRIKSNCETPKMLYHPLADSVFWEDEGIQNCNPELENIFRYVISHRTNLIVNAPSKTLKKKSKSIDEWAFNLAKKYYPNWIGFHSTRCEYNPEISKRIERMRKVSDWKMEKLINSDQFDIN